MTARQRRSAYSAAARKFVGAEIAHLVRDKGYTQARAVAAALSQARRAGLKVPPRARNPLTKPEARSILENGLRELEVAKSPTISDRTRETAAAVAYEDGAILTRFAPRDLRDAGVRLQIAAFESQQSHNPLTKREARRLLRAAGANVRSAEGQTDPAWRAWQAGRASGEAEAVRVAVARKRGGVPRDRDQFADATRLGWEALDAASLPEANTRSSPLDRHKPGCRCWYHAKHGQPTRQENARRTKREVDDLCIAAHARAERECDAAVREYFGPAKANPLLAIVGADLIPALPANPARSRRESNPGPNSPRARVRYAGSYGVSDAGAGRGVSGFSAARGRYRTFHKATADQVDVIRIDDGKPGVTRRAVVALGTVPESVYEVPFDKSSNKHGSTWVHKHPRGKEPLEVLDPVSNLTFKIPGPSTRVTDWWRG